MCGRFVRTSSRDVIAERFGVTRFVNVDLQPRYNVAPSQSVEAIIRDGAETSLGPMRWGFSPSPQSKLAPINARAETVATSPLFRNAFHRHRCLVVADGFYEWRKDGPKKTPYFVHMRSGNPFGLAGIWCLQRAAEGTPIVTCAILTCAANELMAPIHNRMPVILPTEAHERWLEPDADPVELGTLLTPLPSEEMDAYPVSTFVNSPRHDSPECIQRVGA